MKTFGQTHPPTTEQCERGVEGCTAGRRGRRPLQGQPAEQDERPRHPPHPVVKWKDEDTGEER